MGLCLQNLLSFLFIRKTIKLCDILIVFSCSYNRGTQIEVIRLQTAEAEDHCEFEQDAELPTSSVTGLQHLIN